MGLSTRNQNWHKVKRLLFQLIWIKSYYLLIKTFKSGDNMKNCHMKKHLRSCTDTCAPTETIATFWNATENQEHVRQCLMNSRHDAYYTGYTIQKHPSNIFWNITCSRQMWRSKFTSSICDEFLLVFVFIFLTTFYNQTRLDYHWTFQSNRKNVKVHIFTSCYTFNGSEEIDFAVMETERDFIRKNMDIGNERYCGKENTVQSTRFELKQRTRLNCLQWGGFSLCWAGKSKVNSSTLATSVTEPSVTVTWH